MSKKEKKKLPKLPSLGTVIKELFRDAVDGIKKFKDEFPTIKEKLKDPTKTQYELGLYHAKKGNLRDALLRFWITTKLDKNHAEAFYRIGWVHFQKSKDNKAKKSLEKALSLNPNLIEARFLLNIIEKKYIDEIPLDMIKEDADRWADIYESVFLQDMEYKGHQAVCNAILGIFNFQNKEDKIPKVLDLGCGTGLCGVYLRKQTAHITGVDISSAMLKYADDLKEEKIDIQKEIEKKSAPKEFKDGKTNKEVDEKKEIKETIKVYDKLIEGDIISYLRNTEEKFDAISAGYTFNFFGNLKELFPLCKKVLKGGGILAFTVEDCKEDSYKFSDKAGMFIHSNEHIKKTSGGFEIIKEDDIKVYNGCKNGKLYVLKKL